jgi:hypothetical protein
MESKMTNFVNAKIAPAQPQPQNQARNRNTIAAQSRVAIPGARPKTNQIRKQSTKQHLPDTGPFAPSDYEESVSNVQVLVEDSQVDEHGRLFAKNDKYLKETKSNGNYLQQPGYENDNEDAFEREEDSDDNNVVGIDMNPKTEGQHIHISPAVQHALQMQRDGQMRDDLFALGPGSSYPTTTNGPDDDEDDDEDGDDENLSQRDSQDDQPQHQQSQYQPVQPHYAHHRDYEALQKLQARENQFVLRAEDPTNQFSRMSPLFSSRPMALRHSPPAGRVGAEQERRHVPSQGSDRIVFLPKQLHQVSVPVNLQTNTTRSARTNDVNANQRLDGNVEIQPEDESERLDYHPNELKNMSYHVLRAQSFDTDPSSATPTTGKTVGLTANELQRPLTDRIALAQDEETHNQQAFFDSLSIEDWEEAGDWFLEQFGDIMRRMRGERKEKRKLAKELEDEVSKRHELVAGRKRNIEDAMGSMQSSGREVLRGGTPKRSKTPATSGRGS